MLINQIYRFSGLMGSQLVLCDLKLSMKRQLVNHIQLLCRTVTFIFCQPFWPQNTVEQLFTSRFVSPQNNPKHENVVKPNVAPWQHHEFHVQLKQSETSPVSQIFSRLPRAGDGSSKGIHLNKVWNFVCRRWIANDIVTLRLKKTAQIQCKHN